VMVMVTVTVMVMVMVEVTGADTGVGVEAKVSKAEESLEVEVKGREEEGMVVEEVMVDVAVEVEMEMEMVVVVVMAVMVAQLHDVPQPADMEEVMAEVPTKLGVRAEGMGAEDYQGVEVMALASVQGGIVEAEAEGVTVVGDTVAMVKAMVKAVVKDPLKATGMVMARGMVKEGEKVNIDSRGQLWT